MPVTYYNDNDSKVCAWLRSLVAAGLIADGTVQNYKEPNNGR